MPGLVPKTYKGKDTMKMTGLEYEKMLQELGINKKEGKPTQYPGEEPDDATAMKKKKQAMAKGGAVKKKKMATGGLLVLPVKMSKAPAKAKAPAKKKVKK